MRGDNMTTAEIRQIRERLNLTQVEFARELGVCQGTVSHWEKGIRTPTGPAVRLLRFLRAQTTRKKDPSSVDNHVILCNIPDVVEP